MKILTDLPYKSDAEWRVNVLPFGSIYWQDEMPDAVYLFDHPDDAAIIFAIFGLRLQVWDGAALNPQDQRLWDAVHGQVPHWALFTRLSLSDEQRRAREEAEREVMKAFDGLGPSDSPS